MQVHAAQHGKTSPFQSFSNWWWLQSGDHRGPALLSLCFNPLRLVLLEFIQWIWLNLIMYDCVVERWRYHGRCIKCAKFWIQSSIAARPPVNRIRRGVCRMCQQALQLAQINAAPICHGMTVCRSIPFVSWTDWRIFKIPCGDEGWFNTVCLCTCVHSCLWCTWRCHTWMSPLDVPWKRPIFPIWSHFISTWDRRTKCKIRTNLLRLFHPNPIFRIFIIQHIQPHPMLPWAEKSWTRIVVKLGRGKVEPSDLACFGTGFLFFLRCLCSDFKGSLSRRLSMLIPSELDGYFPQWKSYQES